MLLSDHMSSFVNSLKNWKCLLETQKQSPRRLLEKYVLRETLLPLCTTELRSIQNVGKKKKFKPLFCSYHILTSSVIYYWTDARQLGIYLLNRQHQNVLVTKRVAQEAQLNVSLMFLPHFEVFVFHMMKSKMLLMMMLYMHLSFNRSLVRINQIVYVIQLII